MKPGGIESEWHDIRSWCAPKELIQWMKIMKNTDACLLASKKFTRQIQKSITLCMISSFRRDADEICVLLRCYASSSGNSVPTFRDNFSVPLSSLKQFKQSSRTVSYSCLLNCIQDNVARHIKGRTQEGHVTNHGAVAHNAESRDLCSAPNVFCVIRSKEYDVGGAGGTLGGGRIEMPSDFGGEI